MRKFMFIMFLLNLASTPFMIGMFAHGSSSPAPSTETAAHVVSTPVLPSLDACDLLSSTDSPYQGIIDQYSDIEGAAIDLGIESPVPGC